MIKASVITALFGTVALTGCSLILEEQGLPGARMTPGQQGFDVNYQALTMEVAAQLNHTPFERNVERGGLGTNAQLLPETHVLGVFAPKSTRPTPYRIGVGDELQLVMFPPEPALDLAMIAGERTPIMTQESAAIRQAWVGADGSAVFLETGRVMLRGKTLNEAREQIASALVRAGLDPRFQFEVSGYHSQKVNLIVVAGTQTTQNTTASIKGSAKGTGSYPITDRPLTLRELLATAGLELARTGVQVVSIDRKGRRYQMPVEHVFTPGSPDYYLMGGDTVRVEQFAYRTAKAFVLGGGITPSTFDISPQARQTLADILFVNGGPFATKTARNKEIYLLRGTDPMRAYHLNAQDASRLRVAAELELRPKDIVFLSAKPIYSLNELIAAVNPVYIWGNQFFTKE